MKNKIITGQITDGYDRYTRTNDLNMEVESEERI